MWASEKIEMYPKYFCVQKTGIFILLQSFSFSQRCFLSSQTQPPTKLSHSMKHLTYCPPKSKPVFWQIPTNPCAVKHASRTGSKHKSYFRREPLQFLYKACLCRALNRTPGVQRAEALGVFLVTFCTPQKVTEKTFLYIIFREMKSNRKNISFLLFENRKTSQIKDICPKTETDVAKFGFCCVFLAKKSWK